MIQRQGLIVWLKSFKYVNNLRKYGYIHYSSKRMKYVVLYVDKDIMNETIQQITAFPYVVKVEASPLDDIDMSFPSIIYEGERKDVTPMDSGESEFFSDIAKAIQNQNNEGDLRNASH